MEPEVKKTLETDFNRQELSIRDAVKSINNIIFAIITGTFVFSLTFVGTMEAPYEELGLLMTSWIFLIISIVGNILAHYLMLRHSVRSQNIIKCILGDTTKNMEKEKTAIGKIGGWMVFINALVFTALATALLYLFLFVGSNMYSKNQEILIKKDPVPQVINNYYYPSEPQN